MKPVAYMSKNGVLFKELPPEEMDLISLYTHPVKENWKCSAPPCKCDSNNYKVCGYSNYTHPIKELTDRIAEQEKFIKAILKKGGCDGNICQKYNTHPVKELTDEEWNKAFDFYCETDEGVLKFDLELRDEWKKEQLIRWKEALRKAQEK